jgi:nucleoside-diphosphate-sugar epimerase
MTTDYTTPMDKTFESLGANPYTLEEGIKETVEWLLSYQGPDQRAGGS